MTDPNVSVPPLSLMNYQSEDMGRLSPFDSERMLLFQKLPKMGSKSHVKTVMRWKHDLKADWLEYEAKGDLVVELSCKVCKEFSIQKNSPYVTGTNNVHKSALINHIRSDSHISAVKIKQDQESWTNM